MKRCILSMAIILAVVLIMGGNVYSVSVPWDRRVQGDDHPWGGDQVGDGGPPQMTIDQPDYLVTGFTAIDLFFNEYWLRSFKSRYYQDQTPTYIRVISTEEKKPTDEPHQQQRNTNGSKGN